MFPIPNKNYRFSCRWPHLIAEPSMIAERVHRERNQQIESALKVVSGCTVIDPANVALNWKALWIDNQPLYLDKDHLTDLGALQLKSVFEPAFQEIDQ